MSNERPNEKRTGRRKRRGKTPVLKPEEMTQEEIFAKLNASAERTLEALQKAYEAGMKEGLSDEEEDQLIEVMRRAKALRDTVRDVTKEASIREQAPSDIQREEAG